MTQDKMILIKKEYVIRYEKHIYLCRVAKCVGLTEEFQEYLVNNLDDTMFNSVYKDKDSARWYSYDVQGRLDWLDKHIEILGSNK